MRIRATALLGAILLLAAAPAFAAEEELSTKQMEKYLKRVPEADANKDGNLTREELQAYLRNQKSGKSGAAKKPKAQLDAATPASPLPAISALVEALPGKNVITWNDVLDEAEPAPSAAKDPDSIAWAYSEERGYYRVFRSGNPADGFRVLNVEGELQEARCVDDRVIPGVHYSYKVAAYRDKAEVGVSAPVEAVAKQGPRDPVEDGVWRVSAGRFSLDDQITLQDDIGTHGGIGGFAYAPKDRQLYLLYPTLANQTPWPPRFTFEGRKQDVQIRGCVILGSVGLEAPGEDAIRYRVEHSGWDSLIYTSLYPGARELSIVMNGLMPALTVQTNERSLILFGGREEIGTPLPAWVAFSRDGKAVSFPIGKGVSLEGMDHSWLLFWWGDGAVGGASGVDMPCLAVLSARPSAIAPAQGGLKLAFAGGARVVSLMPLFGVAKRSTKGWDAALPSEVAERAAYWERRLKRIPVQCRDRFELRESENRLRVTLKYDYLDAPDDWKTDPVTLAPVAPTTAYAKMNGYPIQYEPPIVSQDFDCFCGPLDAAENATEAVYCLPAAMDAILREYTPQIARPDLLDEVKALLHPDAQVAAEKANPPSHSRRRPRTLSMALLPYLTAWPLLSEASRKDVEQICDSYLAANRYFDLSTYDLRRDRYSGRKYVVSIDPEQRSQSGVTDYTLGAGEALWTLYQYAKVLNKWDEIRAHWESVNQYGTALDAGTDWNRQAPCGTPWFYDWSSSPDFLMADLQGYLALGRMARRVGDEGVYRRSVYQFSRTLLTYVVAWTVQKWAYEHQPFFVPMSGRPPEKGYTFAATVRGEGVVHHFINSFCSNSQIAYWPFTRSCPDLAVFWDLYLREPMGKYLYHDLSLLSPCALEAHALLARAYLFDNDPQRIRQWTDHTYLHIGEWGSANQYALAMAMLCQPPAPIKPPDPQWVHPDFEARIAGQDRPCDLRPFDEVRVSEDKVKSFHTLWEIGRLDHSGQEFSQEVLDEAALLKLLHKEQTDMRDNESLVAIFIENTAPVEEIIAKDDARVFAIGKDTAADWRAIQLGAWTVMGGAPVYKGQHHPRAISFTLKEPAPSQDYYFIAALCDLDSHLPLFMTVEFNDHCAAVRCPISANAAPEAKGEPRRPSPDANVILAFRAPSSWLKGGENRLTIHVEGAPRACYDWLGFGSFL